MKNVIFIIVLGFSSTAFAEIFGGIDFHIPSEWNVINKVVPIFGGCDDTRIQRLTEDEPRKTIVIKGLVLFGGVDIK